MEVVGSLTLTSPQLYHNLGLKKGLKDLSKGHNETLKTTHLWTALNSRRPETTPPLELNGERHRLSRLLINELMAINSGLPVEQDGDRFVPTWKWTRW